MDQEMEQAERSTRPEAKFYVVLALIIAGWLTMFGGVIAALDGRPALHISIEAALTGAGPSQSATLSTFAQR